MAITPYNPGEIIYPLRSQDVSTTTLGHNIKLNTKELRFPNLGATGSNPVGRAIHLEVSWYVHV